MMRRTTWLTVGAVLGVVGYRRLDRATKSLTRDLPLQQAGRVSPAVKSAARLTAGTVGWAARRARRSLAAERGSRGGLAVFVRDVRAGIAEYLDAHEADIERHQSPSGNTLVGQRVSSAPRRHYPPD
jgi:hypothetical protein